VLSGNSFNTAAQLDTAVILLASTTLTRAAWSLAAILAGAGGLITVRRQRSAARPAHTTAHPV